MEEKIALIEEILDCEEGSITLETILEELDEWDSLSKLSLMATAKRDYGKKLTAAEIREFVTVKDICDYLG